MQQPVQPQVPQRPRPAGVVFTFVGPINMDASMALRRACSLALNDKHTKIKILFASNGGAIDEGFALYGFLRALPVELTMHAIGAVESVANIVFLAGQKRLAAAHAHFMLHSISWGFNAQHYETRQVSNIQELIEQGESRYVHIFESRTRIKNQDLQDLKVFEKVVLLKPDAAREKGIIEEVAEATIPADWEAYSIDFKTS
jgi:ATP-dependent protease ClpP protease subunit